MPDITWVEVSPRCQFDPSWWPRLCRLGDCSCKDIPERVLLNLWSVITSENSKGATCGWLAVVSPGQIVVGKLPLPVRICTWETCSQSIEVPIVCNPWSCAWSGSPNVTCVIPGGIVQTIPVVVTALEYNHVHWTALPWRYIYIWSLSPPRCYLASGGLVCVNYWIM